MSFLEPVMMKTQHILTRCSRVCHGGEEVDVGDACEGVEFAGVYAMLGEDLPQEVIGGAHSSKTNKKLG